MIDQNAQKIPKGSYAAGHRVRLPEGATEPIVVYINGVAQTAGVDYDLEGDKIIFTRQIVKEVIGRTRWFLMFISVAGSYRKNETIDVQYTLEDVTELAPDLKVIPDDD